MTFSNPSIFREYDIRGLSDIDFSDSFCTDLGKAIGSLLREKKESLIAVGRDCRLTSEKYSHALVQGLLSTGIDVVLLGVCPTPLMYFSIFEGGFLNGVQITGSHNPSEYNGFKICIRKESLYGKQIQDIRKRIESKNFVKASKRGKLSFFNIIDAYTNYMCSHFKPLAPLKVVVDAGNGVAGNVAPAILRKLGIQVTELYCDLDGTFPNHHPDPTVERNLKDLIRTVKKENADLGIAFDGDADRIGVVDHTGAILWGDKLMILYAKQILEDNPGAAIIGEVKCSRELFEKISALGGRPIMWKTGHSLIKAKIKQEKALLAGEMSGHMFFAYRYIGYDDAIYAALRLLEFLSLKKKSVFDLLADVKPTYATPEIRVDCKDEEKFDLVKKAKNFFQARYDTIDIDGVRIEFPDGWGLIRASNTQPVLVLRFEADTPKRLKEIKRLVESTLQTL